MNVSSSEVGVGTSITHGETEAPTELVTCSSGKYEPGGGGSRL